MAEHVWSVLCKKSLLDKDTNEISLFQAIEGLTLLKKPDEIAAALQQEDAEGVGYVMELVTLWVRTDPARQERSNARIQMMDPQGKKTHPQEYELDLAKHTSIRMRIKFPGIPWRGLGRYRFLVENKAEGSKTWKTHARVPLMVEYKEPESKEGGAGDRDTPAPE